MVMQEALGNFAHRMSRNEPFRFVTGLLKPCRTFKRLIVSVFVITVISVTTFYRVDQLREAVSDKLLQTGPNGEVKQSSFFLSASMTTAAKQSKFYKATEGLNPAKAIAKAVTRFGGTNAWRHIPAGLTNEQTETLILRLRQASNKTKYIFRSTDGRKLPNEQLDIMCGSCQIISDPLMIDHPKTKAVVIYFSDFNWTSLNKLKRRTDQLFVWKTGESPASLRIMRNMSLFNETQFQFNLTESYRRDSDIYNPTRLMSRVFAELMAEGSQRKNISSLLQKKRRTAVAVVSNCRGTTGARRRLRIIKLMKSLGLDIDTFGRCFNNKIPDKGRQFLKKLEKYKFYLAFENAIHCRDYITEKFYVNGFSAGTVPVALGATKEEYEYVAPKGSFISVEDFASISSLVSYLKYLDKNDKEYLKYFRWIQEGQSSIPQYGRTAGFCQLCRLIHGINVDEMYNSNHNRSDQARNIFPNRIASRAVGDLWKWYYETENEDCYRRSGTQVDRLLVNETDLQ